MQIINGVIKVSYLFFVILAILSFYTTNVYGELDELIINGSFEKEGTAGISKNWKDNSRWADVDVKHENIFSAERNGFIQKIICDDFQHGAVQFIQGGLSIRNKEVYRVTFWAKGKMESPLKILLRKQGKPYTTYFSKAFRVSDEWKRYSFIAPVNANDTSAYFIFRFTSKGELLLDDVSVSSDATAVSAHKHKDGNLLTNGNFEIGVDKWSVQYRSLGYEYEMPVRAMGLNADIDSTRSKFGDYSIKIPSAKKARFVLNSENIVLSPDIKYSLTLWVYSETSRNLRIGIKSGYFGNVTESMKTISVDSNWKRYIISTITKPSADDLYFVTIEGSGAGAIWVDGIQLEEGDAKPFNNKTPLEIGFSKQGVDPFFTLNEKISLTVHITAHKTTDDCNVRVHSIDYYGRKESIFMSDCGLKKKSSRTIEVIHPSDKLGYYRLFAEIIQQGKVMDVSEYAIGIIPDAQDTALANNVASPFGGHGGFVKSDLDTLSRLGVKWLRMHPPLGTKWSVVEKEKGQFSYYDKEISLAKSAGFQILGSLDKTPYWASTGQDDKKYFWSYPPENLDDWENYVYKIVSHYKGVIDYWEVWNEPDSNGFLKIPGVLGDANKPDIYVELLKRAYIAAKKANPNAVIIGGCATGKPPSHWLKKIFEKGALKYMDIVSFHYYTGGRPGDALDATIGSDVRTIRKLIQEGSEKILPIWETESGVMYPKTSYTNLKEILPSYPVPGNEAVAYLVRNYVHLLSSGVDKWFYYSMFASHRIDRRDATGFFEWDGAPRPLAIAYAVLASNLRNLEYADSYVIKSNINVTKFVGKERDVMIISTNSWSEKEENNISLDIDVPYKQIIIMNVMGNTVASMKFGETLKFDVGREPLYFVVYK